MLHQAVWQPCKPKLSSCSHNYASRQSSLQHCSTSPQSCSGSPPASSMCPPDPATGTANQPPTAVMGEALHGAPAMTAAPPCKSCNILVRSLMEEIWVSSCHAPSPIACRTPTSMRYTLHMLQRIIIFVIQSSMFDDRLACCASCKPHIFILLFAMPPPVCLDS